MDDDKSPMMERHRHWARMAGVPETIIEKVEDKALEEWAKDPSMTLDERFYSLLRHLIIMGSPWQGNA